LEAVCVIAAPPFEDAEVPALTTDPKDDPILFTALAGGADLLISSDRHLVPDRQEELWEHDGQKGLCRASWARFTATPRRAPAAGSSSWWWG
jgi:hypothetical protein